ncbi:MAG TPA: 50S ribosomal protein L11 methyltransferase [Polyangiaceae bacterium]
MPYRPFAATIAGDILLEPGPGFGDGSHETTQVCLQALAALAPRTGSWRMLDFGSGSGILSIAAARRGAVVDAVEIDALARAHGEQNAAANRVSERIRSVRTLGETRPPFDFVVANILRAVLLDHAGALVDCMAAGATLVLSGLVSTDVPEVSVAYAARLEGERPEVYERGEWRALVWRHFAGRRPSFDGLEVLNERALASAILDGSRTGGGAAVSTASVSER